MRVAATPPSQWGAGDASSPTPAAQPKGGFDLARDEGVAFTFCDAASQLRATATAWFRPIICAETEGGRYFFMRLCPASGHFASIFGQQPSKESHFPSKENGKSSKESHFPLKENEKALKENQFPSKFGRQLRRKTKNL